jgi:hypothetical protein
VTGTSRLADPPNRAWRATPPRWARLVLPLAGLALGAAACGQGPGAGDQSTVIPTARETTGSASLTAYNMVPIGGRFLDADNGSIVRASCTADGCAYQLLTTTDGGHSWRLAAVPGQSVVSAPLDDANAVVLPGGQVVTEIQVAAGRPARHTGDRGSSWPTQNAEPLGATRKVPAKDALVAFCAESVSCSEPVLRVIGPNGASSSYGPPPPTMTETISAGRVAGGALWIQGRDGVGRVLLAVSNDNGGNWRVHRIPAPAAATVDLAGGGDVVWALSLSAPDTGGSGGTAPNAPGRKLRQTLFYSGDAGRSFALVKVPTDYQVNTGGGIGTTGTGNAVISAGGKVVVIAPDGTTNPVSSVHGAVYDLGSQVLVYSSTGSWVSSDGESWSPLPK